MCVKEISAAKLAEITQVQPSTISHIMAGRNNPRYDFLAAILKHYPELNARWLLLGEGEMFDSQSEITNETALINTLDSIGAADNHTKKIVFFNSDGTFDLYQNRDA